MTNQGRFMELVESQGLLTPVDSQRLLAKYKGDAFAVLEYLIRGNIAPAPGLGNLWGESIGVAYVDLDKTLFQSSAVKKLPLEFAAKHRMIPLYEINGVITVATARPKDEVLIREAEKLAGQPISPVFSLISQIEDAIEIQYQFTDSLMALISMVAESGTLRGTSEITAEQLKRLAEGKYIVEVVRCLMLLAIRARASDIHVEPEEDMIRVRFRVDGVLQEKMKFERSILQPLVSRLKIMADLDITERRRPQDGRVKLELSNKTINFRLSTVPFIYGEKVVLRVLGHISSRDVPELRTLNLSASNYGKVKRVVESPNGVFFVTGPTGSGKTTTLFSVLKHLNNSGINIVTVEDPVEYRLRGINQLQVNHEIGFDFAKALRSFLRQDPDVVLIGEIRDAETAKIAAQAALTGHLVLATMHTNSALQAIVRLVEIGVEPFLVAPSIIGVMAQRLVRKICDRCKKGYMVSEEELAKYFAGNLSGRSATFYRGEGCPECNGTGYHGRLAIHEVFVMNERIRSMIAREASILEIEAEASNAGYKSMHYDGLKKVFRGVTTIDELERVLTFQEDITSNE
ncbi:MAG: GspE/PulE family protein [Syntrophobacteraceae bacterium]